MTAVVLYGGSGFVGRAVNQSFSDLGVAISQPTARGSHADLVHSMRGCETVINCAGAAAPTGIPADLTDANVELPRRIAAAAVEAGVERLVHVSSAAVQGGLDVLDESPNLRPFSAYSESKAAAERGLLGDWPRPDCTVIYRPASILGESRNLTKTLVKLFGGPVTPIFGPGSHPLPTALVENCGSAIALLGTQAQSSGIALHPWDGTTQRRLAEAFAPPDKRQVQLPAAPQLLRRAGTKLPGKAAVFWRRLELILYGQHQEAAYLAGLGFEALTNADDYRRLATQVRSA